MDSTPSTKLKIRVINHHKPSDHIEYIISIEKDGKTFQISDRYSNLKALHDNLKKELGGVNSTTAIPDFPPKKFFGSEDEKFLKKRQEELNKYFVELSNNEDLSSLNALKKYINEAVKKENPIQENKDKDNNKEKDGEKKNSNANNSNLNSTNNISSTINSINSNSYEEKISNSNINNDNSSINNKKKSKQDLKKINDEVLKIIKEVKEKMLDLNFLTEPEISEENEKKYSSLIVSEKIMNNDEIKGEIFLGNILPGDDNNFELIGGSNEIIDNKEKDLKDKLEKIFIEVKDIDKVYNTSGLIVPV